MSKDSVRPFITPEGAFVFTLSSNGYKFLTLNLVMHLRALKVPWKLCVVCADAASFTFFRSQGVSCIRAVSTLPDFGTDVSPFGSKQFQILNLNKLNLLSTFSADPTIRFGIYMDGDIVPYSDFLPDILTRLQAPGAAPLYLQCDEQSRVACTGTPSCPNGCTGFVAWSHGVDPALFTVKGEEAMALWKKCPEDQVFVNTMMKTRGIPVMTLPRELYPNGAFASLFYEGSLRKQTTMLLHYNYLVGAAKHRKIKNNGDWILPY
jgi:hypothetical protein